MPPPSTRKLNLKLLKRCIRHAKPYWFSKEKRSARWLLFALFLLLVASTQFDVLFNKQSGEFTSALAAQDAPRFWHSIRVFFGLLVVAVPIYAYYAFVRSKLALNWRRWMTDRFLERYFNNRGYYHLLTQPEIDNPDQRISDDIYAFTQQSLTFLLVFANAILQLIAFGRVLWSISAFLLLIVVLYAAVATVVSFGLFGEKMVSLYLHPAPARSQLPLRSRPHPRKRRSHRALPRGGPGKKPSPADLRQCFLERQRPHRLVASPQLFLLRQ